MFTKTKLMIVLTVILASLLGASLAQANGGYDKKDDRCDDKNTYSYSPSHKDDDNCKDKDRPHKPKPSASTKLVCDSNGSYVEVTLDNKGYKAVTFYVNGMKYEVDKKSTSVVKLSIVEDSYFDVKVTSKYMKNALYERFYVDCLPPPPPPPPDVCPNIEGSQSVVPNGMIKDAQGNCVSPPATPVVTPPPPSLVVPPVVTPPPPTPPAVVPVTPPCVPVRVAGSLRLDAPRRIGFKQPYHVFVKVTNNGTTTQRFTLVAVPQKGMLNFVGTSANKRVKVITLKVGWTAIWRVHLVPTAAAAKKYVTLTVTSKMVGVPFKNACASKAVLLRKKARTYEPPGVLNIGRFA